MNTRNLRIHGDNIIECERTLKMLAEAYNSKLELLNSPVYLPKYSFKTMNCLFTIELLSGHGRWSDIDLGDIIYKAGGHLRESADSYLTEIIGDKEIVILGIEYCSALPAGNNAWQRNGRALSSVLANVPYLYCAEIGGIELDENRNPKAPRFPNPVVPFSYVSISQDTDSICYPVYQVHPTITQDNLKKYNSVLGYYDGLELIRGILEKEDISNIVKSIKDKAEKMVFILSEDRKKSDTLKGEEWKELLASPNRTSWLAKHYQEVWQKKTSDKVIVSDSIKVLMASMKQISVIPVAGKDLPLCIVPKHKVSLLKKVFQKIYKGINVSLDSKKDLALVWITGFKPKGDDSRPDRGLSPLCRMILGKDTNIMAIVYGPGPHKTWEKLINSPDELCKSNGLFESIFSCCNYMFVDSITCEKPIFMRLALKLNKNTDTIQFPFIPQPEVKFFEHDIDCAIHQILSSHKELGVFESFCNPPGGDWSGVTIHKNSKEYMWTSLPRVSKTNKRPDHIFQIERNGKTHFVSIESKGYGKDLEKNIGNRLKEYIQELFSSEPSAYKYNTQSGWKFFNGSIGKIKSTMVSVGAFLYKNEYELASNLHRGNLDAVFAFEFGDITILHFLASTKGKILLTYLKKIALEQSRLIIKIHRF